MSTEGRSPARYRFGPLERRGVVAGWRGGQIAAVAAGLLVAVGVLRFSSSPADVVMAVAAVALGVGMATWPVAGRTPEEWAPDALRHAMAVTGRAPVRNRRSPFAALHVLSVSVDGLGVLGVVHDRRHRTYGVVLRASAAGFVLLGEEDQAGRVARWSGMLATMARDGTVVHRLQWIERVETVSPPSADAPAPWCGAPARAVASYQELARAEGEGASGHEVQLALTVRARGRNEDDEAACRALLREAAALRRRLVDAGVDAGPLLAPEELHRALRLVFDPHVVCPVALPASPGTGPSPGAGPSPGSLSGTAPARAVGVIGGGAWPWPVATERSWARVRTDATWHATFWVAEWPRVDVGPDFLAPLLLPSEVRRTVSVVMEPLGPAAAARRIEKARTADVADAELRRRGGFLSTARRRRQEEVLAESEAELADGHAHYRFAGYVSVSACDVDTLEAACATVEQAAGRAGLELRRCYGAQLEALLCSAPLGRGLP